MFIIEPGRHGFPGPKGQRGENGVNGPNVSDKKYWFQYLYFFIM